MYQDISCVAFAYVSGKPMANLKLCGPDGTWHRLLFLVDSGADISFLPYWVGCQLGLRHQVHGSPHVARGIGGSVQAVEISLRMQIAGEELLAPMDWAQSDTSPKFEPCLGRAGVFDRFQITFDEARRRTVFAPR